jgi:hypothetical protein
MVALALVAVCATCVIAKDKKESNLEKATSLSEIAGIIMRGRQNGMPMSAVIKLNHTPGKAYSSLAGLLDTITEDAYEVPRFSSEEYKKKAIEDFKNKWFLRAYKVFKGK